MKQHIGNLNYALGPSMIGLNTD